MNDYKLIIEASFYLPQCFLASAIICFAWSLTPGGICPHSSVRSISSTLDPTSSICFWYFKICALDSALNPLTI
ncbi:hypothetical protein HYPSUDRAFT_41222, partial [Hypholoma sublateritium FD-334 SS-4]